MPRYLALALLVAAACAAKNDLSLTNDAVTAHVVVQPFSLEVIRPGGEVVLKTNGRPRATRDTPEFISQLLPGWDGYRAKEGEWAEAPDARLVEQTPTSVKLAFGDTFTMEVKLDGARVRVTTASTAAGLNKLAVPFVLGADEHVFGSGERYASFDHRGLLLYSWAEEAGLGGGESKKAYSDDNPFPNGPSMTYFPVPFFQSSAGYGLSLDTTRRTELDFGKTSPGEWRAVVNGTTLPLTVYAADPVEVLNLWTQDTGRPMEPAPWVWGPRRRVGRGSQVNGVPEWSAMRDAGLPLTACDDAMHFLPALSHLGIETELRAWTKTMHDNGFKAIGYNNPYVAASHMNAAADYAFGADAGYFEKKQNGEPETTFFISGAPLYISAVDLTYPAAVAWYETLLQRGVDLGYDGWMHDFGEYVARSSRFHDGRRGDEVHNAFPVLSAKAAHDFFERVKPNDYLFFVRSGFTGTQAYAPAVWSGDPESTFDDTQGMPAQLRGGLGLALSGVPYWGSDVGGFKCITNDPAEPRNKEVLVRWYALGAVSPIMMDQNACVSFAEPRTKWTLWSDGETQDVYRVMASLHTRLAPYFRVLAREAKATGMPLMRPPFLLYPKEPQTWTAEDTFFLGPALFSAPVVRRGVTMRDLWLPPGKYVEWFHGAVYDGGARVMVPAPILETPLFLKTGHILPLLDGDVQTLAPATEPSVVTEATREGVLDVRVALEVGQKAELTLVDGTKLTAERVASGSGTAGFTEVPVADLKACDSCFAKETGRVRVNGRAVDFEDLKLSSSHPTRRIRWEAFRP
ncbi:MAG: glycoside hydrolase family 31 protein [Myxococcaceae bacterium]|nr:glycoside hydrolase family 31 protein [Myxococcaceae bacterium]